MNIVPRTGKTTLQAPIVDIAAPQSASAHPANSSYFTFEALARVLPPNSHRSRAGRPLEQEEKASEEENPGKRIRTAYSAASVAATPASLARNPDSFSTAQQTDTNVISAAISVRPNQTVSIIEILKHEISINGKDLECLDLSNNLDLSPIV